MKQLAAALNVGIDQLLGAEPPSRRAALEIELERYQRGPLYESLNLPKIRVSGRLPLDVLESQIGLLQELERRLNEQVATPEEARRANGELRAMMRERGNYFPEYEAEAQKVLKGVGYTTGPLSQHVIADIADHLGFTLHHVGDLPHSTRSVTDLKNHRIYLTQSQRQDHDPRSVLLQALGHYVLGHETPKNYGDFLAQRVATNYFAAALLLPEHATLEFLQKAKAAKEIAVEDIRDAFAVSYETAAHRFTNLATKHLGITTHFQKTHQSGIIYKAYENDGVAFPQDHTGADRGPAGVQGVDVACRLRRSGQVQRLQPIHGHRLRHVLVHGPHRALCGGGVLAQHRRAVPAREVVQGEGDDGAGYSRRVRTRIAASGRRRRWLHPGQATPGRPPAPTRTCWPPCRRARSPASMRPRCTRSWRRTRGSFCARAWWTCHATHLFGCPWVELPRNSAAWPMTRTQKLVRRDADIAKGLRVEDRIAQVSDAHALDDGRVAQSDRRVLNAIEKPDAGS